MSQKDSTSTTVNGRMIFSGYKESKHIVICDVTIIVLDVKDLMNLSIM